MCAGKHKEPEVYPRPDGTVYICGESDGAAVPLSAGEVEVRPELIASLRAVAGALSSSLAEVCPPPPPALAVVTACLTILHLNSAARFCDVIWQLAARCR